MDKGLRKLLKEKKKSTPAPKLVERSVIRDGSGNFLVSLEKVWREQFGMDFGDSVLLFYDEDKNEVIYLPYSTAIKSFLDEIGVDYREVSLQRFGNSSGGVISIPEEWRKKINLAKGDKAMVLSDWRGGVGEWDPEKIRKYHESMASGVV